MALEKPNKLEAPSRERKGPLAIAEPQPGTTCQDAHLIPTSTWESVSGAGLEQMTDLGRGQGKTMKYACHAG